MMKLLKAESIIRVISVSCMMVICFGCDTVSKDSSFSTSEKKVALELEPDAVEIFKTNRSRLEGSVPEWTNDIGKVKSDLNPSSFLSRSTAMKLSSLFTEKALAFSRSTVSGKEVYASENGDEAVLIRQETGFWKFIKSPPQLEKGQGYMSDAEALKKTLELFNTFEMPNSERSSGYVATGIGEADRGPDGVVSDRYVTARHVRLFREINGIRVWESRFMATYALDGTPFRVEANWPPFRLKAGTTELIDRETVINELSVKISDNHKALKESDELRSQLVYKYDEEALEYEPVLFLHILDPSEEREPAAYEYSLINGFNRRQEIIREDNDENM